MRILHRVAMRPSGKLSLTWLVFALVACSESSDHSDGSAVVATPVDPATAGTVRVEVLYEGPAPQPRQIVMRSAPQCAAAHPDGVYDESFVVREGRLVNAVVWIKGGLDHWVFAPPTLPVIIDQSGCLYMPRVVTAMVRQPIEFRNSDPEAHNVHGRPAALKAWNFMMTRRGSTRTLSFDRPEVAVPIGCDIHPWMSGFVAVVPNPYAAVTSGTGAVMLKNVPPGEYIIGVWHEKLGTKEQKFTLTPSGSADLRVTLGSMP